MSLIEPGGYGEPSAVEPHKLWPSAVEPLRLRPSAVKAVEPPSCDNQRLNCSSFDQKRLNRSSVTDHSCHHKHQGRQDSCFPFSSWMRPRHQVSKEGATRRPEVQSLLSEGRRCSRAEPVSLLSGPHRPGHQSRLWHTGTCMDASCTSIVFRWRMIKSVLLKFRPVHDNATIFGTSS